MRQIVVIMTLLFAIQQPSTITVDVRLQQVVATVRDTSGNIVRGLHVGDFILEDGGVPQKIEHFSDDPDDPISLGILIDVSGSMGTMPGGAESGLDAARGITRILLHSLKPNDEIVLMTFRKNVLVQQAFTRDHSLLEASLFKLKLDASPLMVRRYGTPPGVLTALPPAIEQVQKSKYAKRALILMTDAYFSGDVKQVANLVHQAEVPIFTFAMRGVDFGPRVRYCQTACHKFEILPPPQIGAEKLLPNLTRPLLDTLASESGGRSTIFELDTRDTMRRINASIDQIAAELRGQYVLGYYPNSPSASRVIRVRSINPDYRVFTRRESQSLRRQLP